MTRLKVFSFLCAAAVAVTTAVYAGPQPDKDAHYVSKDVRLYIPHPKDKQGWRELKIENNEGDKHVVFRLNYKRPDSENRFDASMTMFSYEHKGSLTWTDPDTAEQWKVGPSTIKKVAELTEHQIQRGFKTIKERDKLRKIRISPEAGSGYHVAVTGTIDKEPLPQKHAGYVFKANQKTYVLFLDMPLNAAEDKQTMEMIEGMIGGIRCWKP